MRVAISLALVTLLAAACSKKEEAAAPVADAANAPAVAAAGPDIEGPKPGKWRMSSQLPGIDEPMVVETCLAKTTFKEMQTAQQQGGVTCSEQTFRREGAGYVAHASCSYPGGMKATIDSRFTGDFNTRYVTETTTVMDPPPAPGMASSTIKVTAERLGDC
jgi:hypothetical protein